MKVTLKNIVIAVLLLGAFTLTSCRDWLLAPSPGVTKLKDFFTSKDAALQSINAAYVPLAWEFNNTYFPLWFIGDVVSDDALKGGQGITDMKAVYDMENFKTQANNPFLLDFYRAQYQGIGRCNLVLEQVTKMNTDTSFTKKLKDRIVGEAEFLRAMYYYRLVRVFGSVPKVDFVIKSADNWQQTLAPVDSIYSLIISDLKNASSKLWKKSEYPPEDLGRATKGAARALLLKVYLTVHNFQQAEIWGQKIIDEAENTGEYELVSNYEDNFTLAGENGLESVFEIQYMEDPTSDYGSGFGFTRGTFTVILTRPRLPEFGSGWGFNKPTQDLYDAFAPQDPRREATIIVPVNPPKDQIYLGNAYGSRKYAMLTDGPGNTLYHLTHPSRGSINKKIIRYAGVLLMYAEACVENDHLGKAKWALEKVRARARGSNNAILPSFPNYKGYSDTKEDLRKAVRHEHRVELAMEGHRWFNLVRWGIAKKVMDAFKANAPEKVSRQMAPFVKGKDETFPLPEEEVKLGNLN